MASAIQNGLSLAEVLAKYQGLIERYCRDYSLMLGICEGEARKYLEGRYGFQGHSGEELGDIGAGVAAMVRAEVERGCEGYNGLQRRVQKLKSAGRYVIYFDELFEGVSPSQGWVASILLETLGYRVWQKPGLVRAMWYAERISPEQVGVILAELERHRNEDLIFSLRSLSERLWLEQGIRVKQALVNQLVRGCTLDEVGKNLYRFPWDAVSLEHQVRRLFSQERVSLTVSEAVRLLRRRGIEVFESTVREVLGGSDAYEREGEQYYLRIGRRYLALAETQIELIKLFFQMVGHPVKLWYVYHEMLRNGYEIGERTYYGSIYGVASPLIVVKDKRGNLLWTTKEQGQELIAKGEYEAGDRQHRREVREIINDYLHERTKEKPLRIVLPDLVRDIAMEAGIQRQTVRRWLTSPQAQFQQYQNRGQTWIIVEHRADRNYCPKERGETIRERVQAEIIKRLPLNEWVIKGELYKEINKVYPHTLSAFYHYLYLLPLEHYRDGMRYYCRRTQEISLVSKASRKQEAA